MTTFNRIYQVYQREGFRGLWIRMSFKILKRLKPKFTKSAYGIKLCSNWGDATFASYFLGNYGYFFSHFLSQIEKKFVFLDIGANQGLYAILASKNPKCHSVYAFEPVNEIADLLKANIEANSATGIFVHRAAISNFDGETYVMLNQSHSGATTLDTRSKVNHKGKKVKIKTISVNALEDIIDYIKDDIIVKIDVEGHEETVIKELIKCRFFPKITKIYYECNENWQSPEKLSTLLTNNGFNHFKKIGDGSHYDVLASK